MAALVTPYRELIQDLCPFSEWGIVLVPQCPAQLLQQALSVLTRQEKQMMEKKKMEKKRTLSASSLSLPETKLERDWEEDTPQSPREDD